ncbi:MAG: hypothetical protein OQK09_12165 [Colwellia sp.]|nr:hypothetical protein [Colwellia sp.]MCW8864506.1 hypothetical protein [Colwellia sp.]MCW9082258.1 hypothetical protein [Colwellia sp.]
MKIKDFVKIINEEIHKKENCIAIKVEEINQQITDVLIKHDQPIRTLYKLFFDALELLEHEFIDDEDSVLIVPVESERYANKYIYWLQKSNHKKYQNIKLIIKLLHQIHDVAVSNTSDEKRSQDKLRSLKPPELITNFHENSTLTVNISESKSIRKLKRITYDNLLARSEENYSAGKDILTKNRPQMLNEFINHHFSFTLLISQLKSIDPDEHLIKHFRNIFFSNSYRLRYIDKKGEDIHHNICNGLILIDPPSEPKINMSKRKSRSNKKTNISLGYFTATSKGYLNDAGLNFCLTDAEEELINNEKMKNISRNQLCSILQNE